VRMNWQDFLQGAASVATGTLQGQIQAQQEQERQAQQQRAEAMQVYSLGAHDEQDQLDSEEAYDKALGATLPKLDAPSAAALTQFLTDRARTRAERRRRFSPDILIPFYPPDHPARSFLTPPALPTTPAGAPLIHQAHPGGSGGSGVSVMGVLPQIPMPSRRTTAVGVDEPPFSPVPPTTPSGRPHFTVQGVGDLYTDAVSDVDRRNVQVAWNRLLAQGTNATLQTPQQLEQYRRALQLYPGTITTTDDLNNAQQAVRALTLALQGTGPAPTAEKGRNQRFQTGRGDKKASAAETEYLRLLDHVPSWSRVDPATQWALLKQLDEAATRAGHPIELPNEIRSQMPAGSQKQFDLSLKRYQLAKDEFSYRQQQDTARAQLAAGKRLAADAAARKKMTPAQNKLYGTLLGTLTAFHREVRYNKEGQKRTVLVPNSPEPERRRALRGLYDLEQATGMTFPGIGLEEHRAEFRQHAQTQQMMDDLVAGKHLAPKKGPVPPKQVAPEPGPIPPGATLSARDRVKVARHLAAGTFGALLGRVKNPSLRRLLLQEHRRQTGRDWKGGK
jgi:hypothetical protein